MISLHLHQLVLQILNSEARTLEMQIVVLGFQNFRWWRWGVERRVKRAQTRERGLHRRQQNFLQLCYPFPVNNVWRETENDHMCYFFQY